LALAQILAVKARRFRAGRLGEYLIPRRHVRNGIILFPVSSTSPLLNEGQGHDLGFVFIPAYTERRTSTKKLPPDLPAGPAQGPRRARQFINPISAALLKAPRCPPDSTFKTLVRKTRPPHRTLRPGLETTNATLDGSPPQNAPARPDCIIGRYDARIPAATPGPANRPRALILLRPPRTGRFRRP